MNTEQCQLLLDVRDLLPGWGCCKCRTYNGLQRPFCKRCGHDCCNPNKPLPEKYGMCNECGVPKGIAHIGHVVKEVIAS
jgi:hypothetical protein